MVPRRLAVQQDAKLLLFWGHSIVGKTSDLHSEVRGSTPRVSTKYKYRTIAGVAQG